MTLSSISFKFDSMRAHIVIIGAGISGLTSAITIGEGVDRLIADGRQLARPEITILEATDWVGGRAHTVELSSGITVDAGAHWFHGGAKNPFYKWACDRHYDLGPISIDTATRRFNVSTDRAIAPEQREWAMNRLFEMYAIWKAQHPDEDISLRQLAEMSRSRVIAAVAEERANNWMAVDSAANVSSDEFWGDDAGSGGMQLQEGIGTLIAAMTQEAEYYKADIRPRSVVKAVRKAKRGFAVVTDRETIAADYVVSTMSVGALKSNAVQFSKGVRSQLDPVLAGMTAARMTKIFVPLRPEFMDARNIAPDSFVTLYDHRHSWLLHLRTDGKPIATIFASGAMSDLVEKSHYADMESQMLDLLDRVGEPDLSGARDNLEGSIYVTDWTTHPNFLGAYSATLPGVKRRNPLVVGNMVFAGEAFVQNLKKSPSQMTGAWESGRVAGRKILRKLALASVRDEADPNRS
jgi:monoamine oxidase